MTSHAHHKSKSFWVTYKPLIIIVAFCLLMALAQNYFYILGFNETMYAFMAYFFIFLSLFKMFDLKGFANGFADYDLLAQNVPGYGRVYPFIELTLGLGYLVQMHLLWVNWATLIVMAISGYSVIRALSARRRIKCACLGTMLDIPLSTVSVVETVGMGLMAAYQLFVV